MVDAGADAVGANCEQDPARMLSILREMRGAVSAPLAARASAFRTTDDSPCFTRMPQFPDELETLHVSRKAFYEFGRIAKGEGIRYLGGCCGCNAAYIRELAYGLQDAGSAPKA